jgi:N-formylglutamate amidohydrolase
MTNSLKCLSLTTLAVLLYFNSEAQTYIPGNSYFDTTSYVEYRAGNLPIILSAPHGGNLEPDSLPDRTCSGCVTLKDSWTKTISEGVYEAIVSQTGCYPHLIINLLHRKKFDANRDIGDAADGNAHVEQAWYGYHAFIDSAKAQTVTDYGRGTFLDIHGHAHSIQRIELGYLLSGTELQLSDSALNTSTLIEESSIRTLVGDNIQGLTHSELIRGTTSMGTIFETKGFPSVPSLNDPFPLPGEDYFSGGYNTVRHGSRDNNGEIDAIQLELNQDVRFNDTTRAKLIDSLAVVALEYIDLHYNTNFSENYCDLSANLMEETNSEEKTRLFPNPSSEFFQIESQHDQLNVRVLNPLGQTMIKTKWEGNPIEIKHIPHGYYIVLLEKEGVLVASRKLFKI